MAKETAKKPGEQGFSLTELLIGVMTIAVLSGVAVPMLSSSMRNMQLAADAQNISATLSSARVNSKSSMTPHRISIDPEKNEWSLERFNRDTNQFELKQDVNQLSSGMFGSGIRFMLESESHPGTFPSEASNTITFNTRGIPVDINNTPTSSNIIYLSKSGSDYAISVTLTGKVQVWKNDEDGWEVQ